MKLIKQLKSVGFTGTMDSSIFRIEIKGSENVFKYNTEDNNFWLVDNLNKCDHYNLSFEAILKTIEDITGEVLTPKPSKAQRIAALEERVQKLEQNQSIATLEKVAQTVKDLHLLASASGFEPGGVFSDSCKDGFRVHENETILDKNILKEITPQKKDKLHKAQEEKEQPEEPAFKVGDEVVLKCDTNNGMDLKLVRAILAEKVLKIDHFDNEIEVFCVPIEGDLFYFEPKDLQHASSKVFQIGDEVVINSHATGLFGAQIDYQEQQKPLKVAKINTATKPTGYICDYGELRIGTFPAKWLQHAPKKELQFGKPCMLGAVSEAAEQQGYKEGDTVLYLGNGSGFDTALCMKEDAGIGIVKKEDLKPL